MIGILVGTLLKEKYYGTDSMRPGKKQSFENGVKTTGLKLVICRTRFFSTASRMIVF